MLIKMWITYLLIIIPPFVEGKNTAETAYLWTKNAKKTGLSTTFPQIVDIWIVTMWKCGYPWVALYIVKKNFVFQYVEAKKAFI